MSYEMGFLVAADQKQEWLLPWWWKNYSCYNSLPVTFVDLGLSLAMQEWCQNKGGYICLPKADSSLMHKNLLPTECITLWEQKYGSDLWQHREAWFKKPLACLLSPYTTTAWMDLDCEVKGLLESIFFLPISLSGVACCSEYLNGAWIGVNTGVIVFNQRSPLITEWATESVQNSHLYAGDQDVLSALIARNPLALSDLPICYNHSRFHAEHTDALIIHWHGAAGKQIIASSMYR